MILHKVDILKKIGHTHILFVSAQTPMHLASSISHCKSTLLILLLQEDTTDIAEMSNKSGETPKQLAQRNGIYAPLFEMIRPAVSYINSLAFTCNPYVGRTLHS